jgi:hypothetical protein
MGVRPYLQDMSNAVTRTHKKKIRGVGVSLSALSYRNPNRM